ncbi:MAG TPA: VCBS repeat-containing protein [Kofleriaceae bacterium]|nr:VCBS repeat-containing protein [Kofleriaceae bacterium]
MRALLACGLAALAACHDLPDLGSCGNRIVEQAGGEACDDGGDSATCTARCELKCTASAVIASYVDVGPDRTGKAVYCPDASYRCGNDGVCRAPSGAFEPLAAALPFDVTTPPVTSDVDNDGLLDLVGTSMTTISVRFGSTGAPLGELVIQAAPSSDAPYAIFDLPANRPDADQPGTVMAIPTEGVALLRSDGTRFTPELDLPFEAPRAIGEVQGIVVRDPDPAIGDVPIAVQSQSATPGITVARVAVGLPPLPIQVLPPCVASGNQPWHTIDVKAAPDRQSFVVVTQRDNPAQPAAQPWHVCRYTSAGTSWALADLELPPPTPSSIALANLDGDACLELVVHSDGAPGLAVLDATGAGCGFAATTTPLPIAGAGAALLGAGQITPGGLDELVLADGVYRACAGAADCGAGPAGTFVRVAGPTFPTLWSAAAIADLNGDGALDVVAGRVRATDANPTPTGDASVDIVRGGAIPNVYSATTSEPVTSLVAGDFDGDRLGDVAMIESAPPGDRISVLFGTHEATAGAPVAMSPFGGQLRIGRASEIHWLPTTRSSDGIDDLVVIRAGMPGTGDGPSAGLLVGDAARLMTTPHFPPTATTTAVRPLGAVAAGSFGSDDLELLTLTGPQAQLYNVMANSWAPAVDLGMQLDQPVAALRGGPGPTRAAARGDGNTVVVFGLRGALTTCQVTAAGTPIELRGIDIDGDGIDELAVFFTDGSGQRTLQLFRTTGCPLEPLAIDALTSCVDVVNAGKGLVAICRAPTTGSSPAMTDPAARNLIAIASAGGTFVATQIASLAGDARFVTAGDFDGDGVLDVAVGVHRGSGVGVQLLRQCPAHDTRACP